MLLQGKKVVIPGAGPVGLTMARLLQQEGVDVTVYERDRDAAARIWGGTLDLHEDSGQVAMKKAGLLESYFTIGKPMGRSVVDEQCNQLFAIKADHESPEINRDNLRKILLDSLAGGTVVWDQKFTQMEPCDGRWRLHFENGLQATADLVIVANGGMSNAREYVMDAAVEITGSFIIQGEVDQPEVYCTEFYQLCGGNILMTTHGGISFVANPDNNGALAYSVTFRTPAEWAMENGSRYFPDSADMALFLSSMLAHWHPCFQRLIQATSYFVGLPSRKVPIDRPWKNDRPFPITLVGDAAHLMPPFAGKGVNTGLMDALCLSENLTNGQFNTVEAAIKDYEQKMMVYAAAAQLETSRNETAMYLPNFSFIKRSGH